MLVALAGCASAARYEAVDVVRAWLGVDSVAVSEVTDDANRSQGLRLFMAEAEREPVFLWLDSANFVNRASLLDYACDLVSH